MAFPDNQLEAVLADLRAGTGSADQLLRALADNELWVPLPGGASNGQAQLPVMVLDGAPYVAVYTSQSQYARGAGEQTHMVLRGRELAGMMAEDLGLAVNPGGEVGLPVRPEGVRSMREGRRTVRAGERLRLGEPAEEPYPLLAELRARLQSVPAVSTARRALAQAGDEPPVLLIGIEASARAEALAAVKAAVAAQPVPLAVDTVFLDDPADPVAAWMLDNTDPFYRR
jgi:SseB protein C-terminal domain/SseB protein N-terminal domain